MSPPLPHLVAAGRRLEYRWIPASRRDAPTRWLDDVAGALDQKAASLPGPASLDP